MHFTDVIPHLRYGIGVNNAMPFPPKERRWMKKKWCQATG